MSEAQLIVKPPGGRTRVVVIDASPVMRQVLSDLVATGDRLEVVGMSDDGPTGVAMIERLVPDVALLDVGMLGLDGITVARRVRVSTPATKVLFLSAYEDALTVSAAIVAGATGFVSKFSEARAIPDAVERVARGEPVFPSRVSAHRLGDP